MSSAKRKRESDSETTASSSLSAAESPDARTDPRTVIHAWLEETTGSLFCQILELALQKGKTSTDFQSFLSEHAPEDVRDILLGSDGRRVLRSIEDLQAKRDLNRTDLVLEMFHEPVPDETIDEKAFQTAVEAARLADSPSTIANSVSKFQDEQKRHPTYNGRPNSRIGPPITIYNRTFAIIRDRLKDLSKEALVPDLVVDTSQLFDAVAVIYDNGDEREDATYPILEILLGVTFDRKFKASYGSGMAAESDAASIFELEDGSKAIIAHAEHANELGLAGQSGVQGLLTLRKHLASTDYTKLRNSSHCPCLLISIAGPYVCFADDLHRTERVEEVSKIFGIFRDALNDLKAYYSSFTLSHMPSPARLYPSPMYKTHPPGPIQFIERLRFPGWDDESYHCSLFKAKLGDEPVIVKFCEIYGEEAHTIIAAAGLAPRLRFVGALCGGGKMVVMDDAKGEPASVALQSLKVLPSTVIKDLESALDILHANDLVYGDLRLPNIIVRQEGSQWRASLIDFDWSGAAGAVCYPPNLNTPAFWGIGAGPCLPILKEHDLGMLELL
ncbi:Protein kinase domain-containing protein [Pleurotus pulmonarius]